MICPVCHAENADNSSRCTACGAVIQTNDTATPPVNLADYALPYEEVTPARGKTLGITGMCLGLLAWVAALIIPFVNAAVFAAVPLALVSAVLSVIAAKRSREAGFYNLFALVGMIAVALLINAAVLCGAVMLVLRIFG